MMYEYNFVIKYVFFCLIVSCILTLLSVLLVDQEPDVEKHATYDVVLILLVMLEVNLMLNFI